MNVENPIKTSGLLFGMSWEDPESDRAALQIQPGDTVFTISSGGCNTLALLLENPGRIYALDINPCQSYLLELKCAAIRRLECDELHAFLGFRQSSNRVETFESLGDILSPPALEHWRERAAMIRAGIAQQGRYERFLRHFRRLLRLLQGRSRIEGWFRCQTLEEQQEYFDTVWNTAQWRLLFRLAFNKLTLGQALSTGYFQFDDGAASLAEGFFHRATRAFREAPVASNYFLAQYLLGRYVTAEACPDYLRRENLSVVRERLDRIEAVTADARLWLSDRPEASIDAFSLSNICDLMSLEDTARTFEQVARAGRPGARICLRNLVVQRESLHARIHLQSELSRRLIEQDRSFVYSRVLAYSLAP